MGQQWFKGLKKKGKFVLIAIDSGIIPMSSGFAETIAYIAITISHHDYGTETEAATTFNNLGYATDMDYLINKFIFFCIWFVQGYASLAKLSS